MANMMPWKNIGCTLVALTTFEWAVAQGFSSDSMSASPPRVKVLPVPALGHSPETGTYIGAVALFMLNWHRDSATRASNAKLELNYTWRKQLIVESEWSYFIAKEKWFTEGRLHYSKYPDRYYGIGANTANQLLTHYQSRRIIMDMNVLRKVEGQFFFGPQARYLNYYDVRYDTDAYYFPELKDAETIGIGYTILKDTRNNLLNATNGIYLRLTNTYNKANSNYVKLAVDARLYPTPREGTTIALRWYNEGSFGDPPFYDYAMAGGDETARGYLYGRYRERNLSSIQTELRQQLIWRIGITVFGGITKLYPDVLHLGFQDIQPNYGGGIRFLIDRKEQVNLRIDYARGIQGQSGFYIAFGESF